MKTNNNDAIHHLDKLDSNHVLAFELFSSKVRHFVFKYVAFCELYPVHIFWFMLSVSKIILKHLPNV